MSEKTGESISVMGENQEVVNYIADHVKFSGNSTNKTNNTTDDKVVYTPPTTNNSKSDNDKKYSQADLEKARVDGYLQGYDDSMLYYEDYGYDYNPSSSDSSSSGSSSSGSSSSGGSSSSSGSSNVETTTG